VDFQDILREFKIWNVNEPADEAVLSCLLANSQVSVGCPGMVKSISVDLSMIKVSSTLSKRWPASAIESSS
jgi:hypothetical protein